MSATAWLVIAIVGFSLSGVALVVAILMFIKMNIPAIIGDLTGKTVAREIKAMRDLNESNGDRRFRTSKVNMERGTLTEKVSNISLDVATLKKAHASKRLDIATEELSEDLAKKKGKTAGLADTGQAAQNIDGTPTETLSSTVIKILRDNVTEELSDSKTEVLNSGSTTVLMQTEKLEDTDITPVSFKVIKSEIVVHSEEVI